MEAKTRTRRTDLRREAARCLRKILEERENSLAAGGASAANLRHFLRFEHTWSSFFRALLERNGLALAEEPLAVVADLAALSGNSDLGSGKARAHTLMSRPKARRLLERRTTTLLGPQRDRTRTRIMVTAPEEVSDNPDLIRDLVKAGASILRVNCARGDAEQWKKIAADLRQAERETGLQCRLFLDLAGPKMRTVEVTPVEQDDRPPRVSRGTRILLLEQARKGSLPDLAYSVCATISHPEIFKHCAEGQRMWIDDATVGGAVVEIGKGWAVLQVDQVRGKGRRLRPDRSLNAPSVSGLLTGWTDRDRRDLTVAAAIADMVGLSFVSSADQIREARARLMESGGKPHCVVKVENRMAVNALPELLVEALKGGPAAVLIARGDLAAECGFAGLADLQERIITLSHAAHLPVILATQLLDRMVRDGIPTRAEVIDAAVARRVECCMLNRGDHLPDAVELLRAIVR